MKEGEMMVKCIWCGDVVYPGEDGVEGCPHCGYYFHIKHQPRKGNKEIGPTIGSCYKLLLSDAPEEKYGAKPEAGVVEYQLH